MKQKKTIRQHRKKYLNKYLNKLKRTRKIKHINYAFSKIHPASIMLHKK